MAFSFLKFNSPMNAMASLVVLVVLVGGAWFAATNVLHISGVPAFPTFAAAGVGGGVSAPVNTPVGGTTSYVPTLQVSTVNLQTKVTESVAATNGVKTQVAGSFAWYEEGTTAPFETTTLSTTAYASSTSDPAPGKRLIGIFTNASYYPTLYANGTAADGNPIPLVVPFTPEYQYAFEADLLNNATIQCQNSSTGAWYSTTMFQTLGTDESKVLNCKLVGAAARGKFRAPIVYGMNFENANNYSTTGTQVVGSTSTAFKTTGTLAGYDSIGQTNMVSVTDFNEVIFQVRIEPLSGVNPSSNVTLAMVDCGATYAKSVYPNLFSGCENFDTGAAIGSADPTFVIQVN